MLSCIGARPAVIPPPTPAPVAFSQIGNHVLPDKRLVEIKVEVAIADIGRKTKKVQTWIPYPATNAAQAVFEPIIESPAVFRPIVRLDANYNTPLIFVLADQPLAKEAASYSPPLPKDIAVTYTLQVERLRASLADKKPGIPETPEAIAADHAGELKPVVGIEPAEAAAALAAVPAAADNTPLARARAIYDYVVDTFQPDNSPTAKPVKDTLAAKRGGAFDYALATVTLMRAAGIPARVEVGVTLPENRSPDPVELTERTAWVVFYANGFGWTSCDPFAADRAPELKDYLFGGVDANRVQLAVGPAPALQPVPDSGAPIFLTGVLSEGDGKLIPATMKITFRDVCAK